MPYDYADDLFAFFICAVLPQFGQLFLLAKKRLQGWNNKLRCSETSTHTPLSQTAQ